ncbi:MAG: hypothetical protein FD125_1362 [bacterium]|nr:MAG: hypothetical protein FD125_1362 [bacterium]
MKPSLKLASALLILAWSGSAEAQDGPSITLTAQETPAAQPWTKPASLSWIDSTDQAEERFNAEGALKIGWEVYDFAARSGGPDLDATAFGRVVAAVNDQDAVSKRKSTYKGQIGLQFDWLSGGRILEGTSVATGSGAYTVHDWSVYADAYVSYDQARTFGNPASAACVIDPLLAACGDQDQTSYRLVLDLLPHHRTWSGAAYANGPDQVFQGISYDFSPQISLFHDEIINAVLNDANQAIDGGVTGARATVGGVVSPPLWEYRLAFRASYQHTWAFKRSAAREPVFGSSTGLFTASIDYAFIAPANQDGWVPSIGISYTSGEDPLEGRKDRDDTSLMLRLTYK